MTIIQCVCMYCRAHIGMRDGHGLTGISHGICPVCLQRSETERMALYYAYQEVTTK